MLPLGLAGARREFLFPGKQPRSVLLVMVFLAYGSEVRLPSLPLGQAFEPDSFFTGATERVAAFLHESQ
jgi:hypothetical protein